ncbi:hypothetical protein GCM10017688_40900 [Streptomyces ramulosus]
MYGRVAEGVSSAVTRRAPDHARHEAHLLRNRGRTAARNRRIYPPSASLIDGRGALADVLADAYERAGAPSPAAFTRPAAGLTPVPRTTLYNIINRRRLPAAAAQLDTFLAVCRVRPSTRVHIRHAWQRLRAFTPPNHKYVPSPGRQIQWAAPPAASAPAGQGQGRSVRPVAG